MSGKLNTKDIKTGGGSSKTLEPGNQQFKIAGVELEVFKLKEAEGALNLILHMEGPDLGPTFEGFFINKDDESLGRHKGAVGKVKAGEWAFIDGTTKTGIAVSRDQDILKFLKNLCTALGGNAPKWLTDQDGKHDTIESLVSAFNVDQPYKDKYLNYCLAGKEWKDKKGYTRYELFLPKFSKNGVPFEATTAKPSKILKYNDADHLKKAKVTEVTEFGNTNESPLDNEAKQDFQL
jgi:hypothetical protein